MSSGLCQGPARLQAAHRRQPPLMASVQEALTASDQRLRTERDGYIETRSNLQSEETGGRDADYFKLMPFESKRSPQYGPVAAKFALPECIADHCTRRRAPAPVTHRGKEPPVRRRQTHRVEEFSAHQQASGETDLAPASEIELHVAPGC